MITVKNRDILSIKFLLFSPHRSRRRSFSAHLVDEAGSDQLRRFLVAFEVFEEDVGVEGADGVEIAEENGLLAHQARRNEIFQLGIVHLRGITLETQAQMHESMKPGLKLQLQFQLGKKVTRQSGRRCVL